MNNKNIKLKKLVLNILILAMIVLVEGCNPLDIEPTTHVGDEQFWSNPALARNYVNNFYTWTLTGSGDKFQSEQWTDNCMGNYETDWDTYRQEVFTKRRYDAETGLGNIFTVPWASSYNKIRSVNIGLEKIGGSDAIEPIPKAQLVGESYFFRAWVYFEMEQFWGTVPYVDKVLTVFDETFLPRIKREQLFDNILEDLDKAITNLKINPVKPDIGIVNPEVAQAFKSRVALFAGCAAAASANGIHDYDDPTGLFKFTKTAQHYYEIAYNAAQEVINSGNYSLENKYEDLFNSATSYKSQESIFPVLFNRTNREEFNPTGVNGPDGPYYGNNSELIWDMRSGVFPTQDLVDCYYQKDNADGQYKPWWETQQAANLSVTETAGEFSGSGENYRDIFKERDSRFYATITYDGAYMGPTDQEIYQIQTWIDNSNTTPGASNSFKYSALHSGFRAVENLATYPNGRGSAQTITGYYSRKYSHFDKFAENGALNKEQRTTCYFNIRYAEVLLNSAEAAIRTGNSGDAEAKINLIRNRAGIGDYNPGIAGHDLLAEYKLQRRIEFAFESPGFRYFDLLRWGEAEGKTTIDELNTFSRGIHIFRKGRISTATGTTGTPMSSDSATYFTPKFETAPMSGGSERFARKFNHQRYYFYPVSSTLQSTYTNLIQNPGWTNTKWNQ